MAPYFSLTGLFNLVCHVQNHFLDSYYPTIESTYAKSVVYKGVEYDCHIIDTAGQVSIPLALSFLTAMLISSTLTLPLLKRTNFPP